MKKHKFPRVSHMLATSLAGLLMLAFTPASQAGVVTDTLHIEPLEADTSYVLAFDFGAPLSNITLVELTMDPCNLFENELPTNCRDTIGTAEPVTVAIADQSPVFVPATANEIDLPLSEILSLSAALLADLADGNVGVLISSPGRAEFVDFTLTVTTGGVPVTSSLALFCLGALGLGFRRRKNAA